MSETKPARVKYLTTQRGVYTFKRDVPEDVRPWVAGMPLAWWRTLDTRDMGEALARLPKVSAAYQRVIDAIRAANRSKTPATIMREIADRLHIDLTATVAAVLAPQPAPAQASVDAALQALLVALHPHLTPAGRAIVNSLPVAGLLRFDADVTAHAAADPTPAQWASMTREQRDAATPSVFDAASRSHRDYNRPLIAAAAPALAPDTLTLSGLCTAWLAGASDMRADTKDDNRRVVRRLVEYLGDVAAASVSHDMLIDYRNALARLPRPAGMPKAVAHGTVRELLAWGEAHPDHARVAAPTVNFATKKIKAMFRWAGPAGEGRKLASNPAEGVRDLSDDRTQDELYRDHTRSEAARLVAAIEARHGAGGALATLFRAAYYTGARQGELLHVKPAHVIETPDAGLVFAVRDLAGKRTKNAGSARFVPVHDDIADAVRALRDAGGEFLFPFNANHVQNVMERAKTDAGVCNDDDGKVSFHGARGTFHTEARRVGISAEHMHAITGHAEKGASIESKVSRKYGRGACAPLRAAIDKMDPLNTLGTSC